MITYTNITSTDYCIKFKDQTIAYLKAIGTSFYLQNTFEGQSTAFNERLKDLYDKQFPNIGIVKGELTKAFR